MRNIKIWILLVSWISFLLWWIGLAGDLMDTVFQPSREQDSVINIGRNKTAVWNEIFRESWDVQISAGFRPGCFETKTLSSSECTGSTYKRDGATCYVIPYKKEAQYEADCKDLGSSYAWVNLAYAKAPTSEPLIVRISKVLLRLTIAVSVLMMILVWVKVLYSTMQWTPLKEAVSEVQYILWWIALALWSVIIITLIESVVTTLTNIW